MPHTPEAIGDFTAFGIEPNDAGHRVDVVLARVLPGLGLRARRRACCEGLARLNGRPVNPAYKVRPGQNLFVHVSLLSGVPESGAPEADNALSSAGSTSPQVVCRTTDGLLVSKPACLHTVSLAGSHAASLEQWLTVNEAPASPDSSCPHDHASQSPSLQTPCLLNRLDYGTSGLVAAALTPAGLRLWKAAEASRQLDKRYLALVHGRPEGPAWIRRALDAADRRLTRCLPTEERDPLRHTRMVPLGQLAPATAQSLLDHVRPTRPEGGQAVPDGEFWLVGCRISKGARHQIRVHLAAVGLPLCGDPLYGLLKEQPAERVEPGGFVLHHGGLHLSRGDAAQAATFGGVCDPSWLGLLPAELLTAASAWLREPEPDIT